MNDAKKINLKALLATVQAKTEVLRRYSIIGFVVFVACLYGAVVMRVNNLSNMEPTDDAIQQQVKAARVPHIDQEIVKQLESLEDHSVSVKALFDEARSNPFQSN